MPQIGSSILAHAQQVRHPESTSKQRALRETAATIPSPSVMISTMKALESGRVQLSAAERRLYADAAAYVRRRSRTEIALAEPLSVDELLFLELTRLALGGDLQRVDQIID